MTTKQDIELTAYCGLYCGDCLRYHSKASNLAGVLLNEFQTKDYGRYADAKSKSINSVKELAYFETCCQVLKAVTALNCDEPCRIGDGCKQFSCSIVKCIREKGYQGCWECDKYEHCERFASLKSFHGDNNIHNLRMIAKYGLDKWANNRSTFYIWLE